MNRNIQLEDIRFIKEFILSLCSFKVIIMKEIFSSVKLHEVLMVLEEILINRMV